MNKQFFLISLCCLLILSSSQLGRAENNNITLDCRDKIFLQVNQVVGDLNYEFINCFINNGESNIKADWICECNKPLSIYNKLNKSTMITTRLQYYINTKKEINQQLDIRIKTFVFEYEKKGLSTQVFEKISSASMAMRIFFVIFVLVVALLTILYKAVKRMIIMEDKITFWQALKEVFSREKIMRKDINLKKPLKNTKTKNIDNEVEDILKDLD